MTTMKDHGINECARRYIRQIVDRDFASSGVNAARRWGVTRHCLASFLCGASSVSMKLLYSVAEYEGVPVETVMGVKPAIVWVSSSQSPPSVSKQRTPLRLIKGGAA